MRLLAPTGPARLALMLAVAVVIGSCASQEPDEQGWQYVAGHGVTHERIDPNSYLLAVGCEAVAHGDTGTIAVPWVYADTSHLGLFKCGHVPADSVFAAQSRFRDAEIAEYGTASIQSDEGSWAWSYSSTDCVINGHEAAGSYYGSDGTWVSVSENIYECWVTDHYTWSPGSGGDGGDDGSGGGGGPPPPPTPPPPPPPPLPGHITVTPGTTSATEGDYPALVVVAYDGSGNVISPTPAVSWSTTDATVAALDDNTPTGKQFGATGPGTATITATLTNTPSVSATAHITVIAVCGSADDPNIALLAAGEDPTAACAPSSTDAARFSDCLSTSNPVTCFAIRSAAWQIGSTACSAAGQNATCSLFLGKLLSGDTTNFGLGQTLFEQMLTDTIGKTHGTPVPNPINPDNPTAHYATAVVWNWSGGGNNEFKYTLGSATIFYDAMGAPVALHDDYDFHTDSRDVPGIPFAVKQLIDNAVDGKSFRVHYP